MIINMKKKTKKFIENKENMKYGLICIFLLNGISYFMRYLMSNAIIVEKQ